MSNLLPRKLSKGYFVVLIEKFSCGTDKNKN